MTRNCFKKHPQMDPLVTASRRRSPDPCKLLEFFLGSFEWRAKDPLRFFPNQNYLMGFLRSSQAPAEVYGFRPRVLSSFSIVNKSQHENCHCLVYAKLSLFPFWVCIRYKIKLFSPVGTKLVPAWYRLGTGLVLAWYQLIRKSFIIDTVWLEMETAILIKKRGRMRQTQHRASKVFMKTSEFENHYTNLSI